MSYDPHKPFTAFTAYVAASVAGDTAQHLQNADATEIARIRNNGAGGVSALSMFFTLQAVRDYFTSGPVLEKVRNDFNNRNDGTRAELEALESAILEALT